MNDDNNIVGAAIGQLGQAVKKAGEQAIKISEEVVKDAGKQIVGQKNDEKPQEDRQSGHYWRSDEERIKYLKHLYGSLDSEENSSDKDQNKNIVSSKDKAPSDFEKQIATESPEEQKKLIELRNLLHKQTYFDPTFNPPKKQEEERPAEKVEKEKKQEMQELQQKEAKKPPSLAIVRERNKAEMFRGVAG